MFRIALLLALICLLPAPGGAFVTLRRTTPDDEAVRWSAAAHAAIDGAGLSDGIQVAIEPDFAEKLALAVTGSSNPNDVADVEAALAASFYAWESPVLRFAITFDGPAQRGEELGDEIDVFLVPESDEAFNDNNYFGVTFTDSTRVDDRLLTNGTVAPGPAITGADIFINETILAGVAPALTREQQLAALQRLMMHEIGHALGFHHPNEFAPSNYDTDSDPLNVMQIDPDDPSADLQLSPNVNPNSVVSNRPGIFEALFFTSLQNDERGGRDALYPVHEPECAGDCDGDRTLAVNELVQAVNIALDRADVAECSSADRDRDTRIRVNELVGAVRNALAGCLADRRILDLATTTNVLMPLPLAINRGTIRFEIVPIWEADQDVPLAAIRIPQSFARRIELFKNGAFLRFVTADSGGVETEISTRVDQWTAEQRHVITATWSYSATALYLDGAKIGEQPLSEPIAHPLGTTLQIGDPAGDVALENVLVFGRP